MGIFNRAWESTQAKINTLLDKAENPNETLDLSYKMLDGLQEVKAHLADVVTEQKRLESKVAEVQKDMAQRDEEAAAALKLGKEDLARAALGKKQDDKQRLAELQASLTHISEQVEKLKVTEQKFQDRLDKFRDEKEIAKASYTAAKAQTQVNASLTGASKAFGGVGQAMQRTKDKTEQMQARSEAVDQLTEEGVFNDPLDSRDKVTKELDDVRKQGAVEDELAALKTQLAGDKEQ